MSARDRGVRSGQTAREDAGAAPRAVHDGDPAVEAAGLAERLDAYGAALGDLARALTDELGDDAA